jgi:4-amino-4-deoxy-L-arabinose transferase-like glycosyltransferase
MTGGTAPYGPGLRRWEALALAVGVVVVAAVAITTRARTLTEEDSANLARALHHYTVVLNQPQPPGYPLVVLSAHAFTWIGSVVSAYVVVAVVATVGTVLMTYLLGTEMFGRRAGVVAALVVCATPVVLYYGAIVSVYPTESLMVPAVALLAHRVARRADRASAVLLLPVLAVGGGFRPTMFVLMLPACGVAIVWGRPRLRDLALGVVAAVGILAAWGVPMVAKSGGWHAYWAASRTLYHRQFSLTSIFYGASLHQAAFNGANALGASAMVALPAAIVTVLAFRRRGSTMARRNPAPWILVASLVPYLVTYFGIQLGKPGYVLAVLPLLAVLAGGLVASSPRAVPVAAVVALVLVVGYVVLPQWPLPWRLDAFFPTAHAIHVQDQEALGLRRLSASCPPTSCTIVSLPTSRRYWYHDPAALAGWYAPRSRVIASGAVSADKASLRQVLWVGTSVPPIVRERATPEESVGTWAVFRSQTAATRVIVRQAFG